MVPYKLGYSYSEQNSVSFFLTQRPSEKKMFRILGLDNIASENSNANESKVFNDRICLGSESFFSELTFVVKKFV